MNRIKDLRKAMGWTQGQLGKRINASKSTVSEYESEKHQLDPALICALCDIFGCTADYLLGRSEIPTPQISDEEWRLLAAWRQADDRARTMVELALEPWTEKKEKTAAS